MFGHRYLKQFSLLFTIIILSTEAQDTDPPKPEFPDVFQVEVQGILRDEKVEVDGSLYYDRLTNRAALHYRHQNEFSISIYNFNDNQIMYIEDYECSVSEIPETGNFFPYSSEDGKNKTLSPTEEFFHFTNSVFDREEESIFPSYVYKGTINATQYGLFNCNIFHVFSKPELELPDCDSHTCKPTLISLSLKCPSPIEGEKDIHHSYNFFRFRSTIIDENIFQPPVGVHCKTLSHKPFPKFPSYYSFSYMLTKERKETQSKGGGVYNTYKKVWHDTKLRLVRVDGFDSHGLLQDTRILDFYGKVSYTIIARIPVCQPDVLREDIALNDLTLLPRLFFEEKPEDQDNVVYIGKRKVHGIDFDVWTQSYDSKAAQIIVVLEYYFSNNAPEDAESDTNYFQISHVVSYAYQKDDVTEKYELVGTTYLSISNFRSNSKEWEAFDVSSCYDANQKKGFKLKVEGPSMIKNSYEYEDVLEQLYMKFMAETEVSVIRINQLKGRFNGIHLVEFRGWILEKMDIDGIKVNNKEPDMRDAIKLIEKAAIAGKFTIVVIKDNEEKTYQITSMTNMIPEIDPLKPKFPDVFQVEVQGIFHTEKREMDGSVFYDRINNRAGMSYTYQNETTISIYDFNENKLLYIEDIDCSVSEIDEDTTTFFPFTTDKVTNKKIISSPEEIFFFTKSKFDRQDLSFLPSYIFTAVLDIPMYGLTDCEVNHIFSKPEVELPDCDSHTCKPTLVSVSVKCPPADSESKEVFHTYNFYRFRSSIKDVSVFQPPIGVHCNLPSNKTFPDFPEYYSFSYDLKEEQMNSGEKSEVRSKHLKIWHDTKLRIVRMDEFAEDGFIEGTRIFDFYGRVAYTITALIPNCTAEFLKRNTPLETITPLPKIFFARTPEEKQSASYIGKRTVNGIDYEVWTQTHIDSLTGSKIIQEFYFTENIPEGQQADKKYLRISHTDQYLYQKDRKTGKYELSSTEYLSISNFKSGPKEWEAFDIASCFEGEQKKGFRLKVEGPPLIKNSFMYESVLEKLYRKLTIVTNASLVRISELKGMFDGIYVTEFTGWILNKLQFNESALINKEPDMHKTYELIEKAAAEGNLTIEINKNQIYKVTEITDIIPIVQTPGSCTSGGIIAAIAVVTLLIGAVFGIVGYYAYLRNIKRQDDGDSLLMEACRSN